jgi:hypothetical protein
MPFLSAQTTNNSTKETLDKTDAVTEKPLPVDESRSWATQGRLYVVVAADVKLDGIQGKIAAQNGETVESLFKSNLARGAFAIIKVPAEQMTRQALLSVITNLPVKPQDAICFYVTSKGGIDRKYGTFFELNKGKEELYRTELRAALAKKNCRLSVLLSDICDGKEIPVKPEPKPIVKPEDEKKDEKDNKDNVAVANVEQETKKFQPVEISSAQAAATSPLFFSLFFQSTGTVDIVSSLTSQVSLPSEQGIGCFTETFARMLVANKSKSLSWYRVFPYIARGTGLTFESIYVEGASVSGGVKQASQTPAILTLGQDDYNQNTFELVYPRGKEFGTPIPGVTENEVAITDDGRKIITQLIQATLGEVRPQDDNEKGTHEDYAALDPDNTVNGIDGEPFAVTLQAIKPTPQQAASSATAGTTSVTASKPSDDKPKLGIQAADNNGDGVKITRVFPNLPGMRAGLEVGDIIISIDGKKINSEKDYSDAVDAAGDEMKVETRNARGGTSVTVVRFKVR